MNAGNGKPRGEAHLLNGCLVTDGTAQCWLGHGPVCGRQEVLNRRLDIT